MWPTGKCFMSFGEFFSLQDNFIETHQKPVQRVAGVFQVQSYKVMFEYART